MKTTKTFVALLVILSLAIALAPAVSTAGPIAYNKPNWAVNVDGQDIWLLNPSGPASGSSDRKLPLGAGMISAHGPVWSRDGRLLAATALIYGASFGNPSGTGGYAMAVFDGTQWRVVATLGTVFPDGVHAAFSPDGRRLAYTVTHQYFVEFAIAEVVNGTTTVLGTTSIVDSPLGPTGYGIDWHPAANLLVAPVTVTAWIPDFGGVGVPYPVTVTQLYLIGLSAAGVEAWPLTNPSLQPQWLVSDLVPAFSPDGTHVAFVRTVEDVWTSARTTSIWVVDIHRGDAQPVINFGVPLNITRLSWSPDGTKLIFDPSPAPLGVPTIGGYGIYRVNLDGTGLGLVRTGVASSPAWSWGK